MNSIEDPLISVVTVCRNSAKTIQRTLESVLQQGYPHIEYLVVDGASTDGTVDIIREYVAKFQSRGSQFRWVSEADQGIYDAMNKGIGMARGEIIGILNSDDFYEPNTLQVIADAALVHPEAGIFYGFLRILLNGEEILTYRYRYERYLLNLNSGIYSATQHPTCFVRSEVYRQVGKFDLQFPVAADHDFLIRGMKAGVKFHALDAILANFSSGGAADQMSDHERHKQRYAVFYKNGLVGEREYRRMQGEVRYKKYKELKRKLTRWFFRF
jgi:glycosyltransferase involved in cell wall biosynthesis